MPAVPCSAQLPALLRTRSQVDDPSEHLRHGPARHVDERVAVRPAAERAGCCRAGRGAAAPLPVPPGGRAGRSAGRALRGVAGRGAGRPGFGGPDPEPDRRARAGAHRGGLPGAVVRGLPADGDEHQLPAGSGADGRLRSRPGRDGRGDHRPHPLRADLQPQQPDRLDPRPGRADRLPGPGAGSGPGDPGRGLPGVRHRPGRRRRHAAAGRPGQRVRAAHLLQGLRPGHPAGRLRDRAGVDRREGPDDQHGVLPRWAGPAGGGRRAGAGGREADAGAVRRARRRPGPVRRGPAGRRSDVPDSQGNFVWLPLGDGAEDFVARCQAAGILLRAHPGLGVRVTVGTDEANQRLLGVVAAG